MHAEWLTNRLADCSIANDKLRDENKSLRLTLKDYEDRGFYLQQVDIGKYNKVLTENKKLRNSLQKLYLKYIEPTLIN